MRNHYLSVSKNPTNHSSSKALYSFSKTKRFSSSHKNMTCDNFYNISSPIGKNQKAGIGYGTKISMLNQTVNVPSPQAYSIKSLFDGCKKGYIFGIGRQKIKNGGIFPMSTTPGPGEYSPAHLSKKLKISFKTKLKPIEDTNVKSPGPGSYNIPKLINEKGKCFLSHVRSSSVSSFGSSRSKSRSIQKSGFPGPGHYQTKQNMSPRGNYFNAKMKNSQAGYFSKTIRKGFEESFNKSVGPGSYDHYTQFGCR